MSIETLLEAAKFVEWSDQIGQAARGYNDSEVLGFSQNGQSGAVSGPTYAIGPGSPSSSPGSHKSLSPRSSFNRHSLSTSNTDTFDEGDDKRSGTREVHNKLEKNRRAQLKECFDNLRDQIPNMDNKKLKPSNLSILQGALRYLQALKRKERELEYETEKLARQKIQYQEKLAKLSGCPLPPWKKEGPELKVEAVGEETEEATENENDDDRDSVSTSTSTASEAEEEERKSRAQSPETKFSQAIQKTEMPDHVPDPPVVRTDSLTDRVIKVTQSVKEQSGPFVISRQIITHVPVSTAAAPGQQAQVPVVKQQQLPGSNHRKPTGQPQTATGPPSPMQPWVVGAKSHAATAQEFALHQPPAMTELATQRVTATQNVVIRPQPLVQQVKTQQMATPMPGATKQTTSVSVPQTSSSKITSHVVRQFDSHSSAVSAVQEHLKNKAQNRLPQQPKHPVRTISHATLTAEAVVPSKTNMTVVSTAAVATATSSAGVSRQTVSQLLGKQSMVIRQPVRRTDGKLVQRVVGHPFSPRTQAVDIMPKSPTALTGGDTAKTHTSLSTPASITVLTYKEPHTTSVTSSTASGAGSNATLNVNKLGVPSCSATVQHVTAPPGLDMRSLISHGVMLPSIPHYLQGTGLATTMLRPSLTNPGVLLSQTMIAGPRNVTPQLTVPAGKDGGPAKLHSPASGPLSFHPAAATQPAKVTQAKPPPLPYTPSLTPGHPFLSPGLTLQPALTQVLFTQPPIAAYTVANSSLPHSMVKTTLSPQTVIRHPLVAAAGPSIQQVVTTVAAAVGTSSASNPQTTVAMTMPPVVTIGAVSLNPLLGANRALVTAPTYTTLSLGQYPQYRFPFAGQVPIISPVVFTGGPSGAAIPATPVGNQTAANGKTSNGVIVHTVAVPAAMPVTSSWLTATTMSNGIPVKEFTLPAPVTTMTPPTSVATVTTQPAASLVTSSLQAGGVADNKINSGSAVLPSTSS